MENRNSELRSQQDFLIAYLHMYFKEKGYVCSQEPVYPIQDTFTTKYTPDLTVKYVVFGNELLVNILHQKMVSVITVSLNTKRYVDEINDPVRLSLKNESELKVKLQKEIFDSISRAQSYEEIKSPFVPQRYEDPIEPYARPPFSIGEGDRNPFPGAFGPSSGMFMGPDHPGFTGSPSRPFGSAFLPP